MTHAEAVSDRQDLPGHDCHRQLVYRDSQGSERPLSFWACSSCGIMLVFEGDQIVRTYPLLPRSLVADLIRGFELPTPPPTEDL